LSLTAQKKEEFFLVGGAKPYLAYAKGREAKPFALRFPSSHNERGGGGS